MQLLSYVNATLASCNCIWWFDITFFLLIHLYLGIRCHVFFLCKFICILWSRFNVAWRKCQFSLTLNFIYLFGFSCELSFSQFRDFIKSIVTVFVPRVPLIPGRSSGGFFFILATTRFVFSFLDICLQSDLYFRVNHSGGENIFS